MNSYPPPCESHQLLHCTEQVGENCHHEAVAPTASLLLLSPLFIGSGTGDRLGGVLYQGIFASQPAPLFVDISHIFCDVLC